MTILGHHTTLEVKQLIAATQSRVDDIQSAYDHASDVWAATDPNAATLWANDWNTWLGRWHLAVAQELGIDAVQASAINTTFLNPFVATFVSTDDVTPDEDGYQSILKAIYEPGEIDTVVDGNINGLDNRLSAAIGAFPRKVPPPEDATDFDSVAIQQSAGINTDVNAAINLPGKLQQALPKPSTLGKWLAGAGALLLGFIGVSIAVPAVGEHMVVKKIRKHLT